MTAVVRVFVNGAAHDAPAGGTVLDAVAAHRPEDADAVRAGAMLVTDSRGLPIAAEAPLSNGTVLRLVPNRVHDAADPAARFEE